MASTSLTHLPKIGLGDASRFYGLSARALRFYEEKGLVVAQRDRRGHRWFDGANRRRLEWIAKLRAADVPLEVIAELFGGLDDPNEDVDFRQRALTLALGRRRQVRAMLEGLDRMIGDLTDLPAGAAGVEPKWSLARPTDRGPADAARTRA